MRRNKKVRAHIFVSGRVQGVFFRSNAQEKAEELGISGWVRNLPDSRVELVLEGEKEKVKEMVEWSGKGPAFAKVNTVEIEWEKYKGEFRDFSIRYE